MLAYVLNDSFIRTSVIESFSSFIWTERYDTLGDCELKMPYSVSAYSLLSTGTYLSIDESVRLMEIKTVTVDTDDNGAQNITVIGEDAARIFADRVAVNLFSVNNNYRITGKPADIALTIAKRAYELAERPISRTNLLYGGFITMASWVGAQDNCTCSVNSNKIVITPSAASWSTRSGIGYTDGISGGIDLTKQYTFTACSSSPIRLAITIATDGTVTDPYGGYWQEDIFPDDNGIYTFPSYATGFRFFRIRSPEGQTTSPYSTVTVSSPTLELYTGEVYGTPFTGATTDTPSMNYSWTGTEWASTSTAIGTLKGEEFRRNLLWGSKEDMTGWTSYTRNCSYSISGKVMTITPTNTAWHIRGDVYDTTDMATVDLSKEYLLTYSASSGVRVAIVVDTPGRPNTEGFEEEDIFPDTNGVYSFPSYATSFRFFRIQPASDNQETSPVTFSTPCLEEYKGFVYTQPFNGATTDTDTVEYQWTGPEWSSESIAIGQPWTVPGSSDNYNLVLDNNQVAYKGSMEMESTEITYERTPTDVLTCIKELCSTYSMGFSLTISNTPSPTRTFYFGIYKGSDRTTGQTALPPVVFSKDLENLTNVSEVTTIAKYKNAAVVTSSKGSVVVYSGNEGDYTGKELRMMQLSVTDLDGVSDVPAYLKALGLSALANQQIVYALDGELSQYSQYVYGKDYFLGDIIEMRGENNVSNNMLVTEQTLIQDENGYRSYPTLTVNKIITPGSWLSATGNFYWSDATGYWADSE